MTTVVSTWERGGTRYRIVADAEGVTFHSGSDRVRIDGADMLKVASLLERGAWDAMQDLKRHAEDTRAWPGRR